MATPDFRKMAIDDAVDKHIQSVGWDVKIEAQDSLREMLQLMIDHEDDTGEHIFAPVTVYSDCPYASYVEFGTGPARNKMTNQVEIQRRLDSMVRWVKHRYNTNPEKAEKVAKKLIWYTVQNGIHPNPQFRAAINRVMEEVDAGGSSRMDYMLSGGSTRGVAEAICEAVKDNLKSAGVQQYSPEEPLADSFKIEPVTAYTVQNDGTVDIPDPSPDPTVTQDMWEDKSYGGRDGKRKSPKSRW